MDRAGRRPSVLIVGPVGPLDGGRASGGVAQHVSGLARALGRAGWRVAVYADDLTPSDGSARETSWGTLFGPVAPRKSVAAALGVRGGLRAGARAFVDRSRAASLGLKMRSVVAHAVGLRIAFQHARPDVVHYQQADLRPYWGTLADIDVPMVVTAHSLAAFRDFDNPALHEISQDALRRADVVLAVSPDTANALVDRAPGVHPIVVGNGIDLSLFGAASREDERSFDRVVLYHGRVMAQKGIAQLVAAMSSVRERVPDALLVVVGAEEDVAVSQLAREAGLPADAVVVTGYLDVDEVAKWVRRADVVALPSLVREGQSRTVMEGMAAGRPIVASRIGAVPDLLGHGEYGLLVEPGDVRELAGAIELLLLDPEAAAALGRRARAAAAAFDIRVVSERVADAYRAAISSHS